MTKVTREEILKKVEHDEAYKIDIGHALYLDHRKSLTRDAFFTENTRIAAEMPSNNKASPLDKTHP